MKIIAIGDLHGKRIWKEIIKDNDFHIVVFNGDYFDCYGEISPVEQLHNFKEIIEYKRENPDKVKVLLGNHDFHYLPNIFESYSGYQPEQKYNFGLEIDKAIKENLLQACYVYEDIIFSHAGVGKIWCKDVFGEENPDNLQDKINDELIYRPSSFRFTPGSSYSVYGDDECQTPIWIRPRALKHGRMNGYRQVVGHTQDKNIKIEDDIAFIDVFNNCKEYLVIENGEFKIETI